MKKEKFDIQGMTCSSCSSHVEKAVCKLDGATKVNVNLLSNSMVVEYDDKILNNDLITKAVIDAGYGAKVSSEGNKNQRSMPQTDKQNETIKSMKKRLICSMIFLIPLMYIAMHHMLPMPQVIEDIFHGAENALIFGFTQLLLLLPIIYLNRNFFIIGFKRLVKGTPNMDSLVAIGSSAAIIYGIYRNGIMFISNHF